MKTGKRTIEDFFKGSIWHDITEELYTWLDDIHAKMEDVNVPNDEFRILQGNAQSVRRVLGLPQYVLQEYEDVEEKGLKDE